MQSPTKTIVIIVLLNLFSTSRGTEHVYKTEWSDEVIPLRKDYPVGLSENHPSTAWISWTKIGHVDHPYLAVERFSFDGQSRKMCQVQLNFTGNADFNVDSLLSLTDDIEVCSVMKSHGSELEYLAIYVFDMVHCEVMSVMVPPSIHVFALQYDVEDAFEIFYQPEKPDTHMCGESDVCRQTFYLKKHDIGPLLPFHLPRKHENHDTHIISVGRRLVDDGYYFVLQDSSPHYNVPQGMYMTSVTSMGELIDSVDLFEKKCDGCPLDTNFDHGYFSACFVLESDKKMVKCLQTDAMMHVETYSYFFDYKVEQVAVHNLKNGGFSLLVRLCLDEQCYKEKFHLTTTVHGINYEKYVEFEPSDHCYSYPDEPNMSFFEEHEHICMIYRCLETDKEHVNHHVHVKCL